MIKVNSAVVGVVALTAMTGLGGCNSVDSHVTWQPSGVPQHDHPYRDWYSYEFIYYPQQQVYFEPYTEEYFWFDDGQWESGTELPVDVHLHPKDGRIVKLQHQAPYLQHETVLQWSWPYNHPPNGSLDTVHRTDEAVALMDQRRMWRESGFVDESGWWHSQQMDHDLDYSESSDPMSNEIFSETDLVGALTPVENESANSETSVEVSEFETESEMVSGVNP